MCSHCNDKTPYEAETFYADLVAGKVTELPPVHGQRDQDDEHGTRARLGAELRTGIYKDTPDFEAALQELYDRTTYDFDVEWQLDALREQFERPQMTEAQMQALLAEAKARQEAAGPEDDTGAVPVREMETA